MKIELRNGAIYHASPVDVKKQTIQTVPSSKSSGKFDGISIQSSKDFSPEQTFLDSLTTRLSMEVRTMAPTQKLEDLQQQIERGTYEVEINSIIEKIMLY